MMKPLSYDASGSAQIRLSGDPFEGHLHEDGCQWSPSFSLLCPDDLGRPCGRCLSGMPKIAFAMCVCRSGKKWAAYMTSRDEMEAVMAECARLGYAADAMRSGNGPDIILQDGHEPFVMPSKTKPEKAAPVLADELGGIYERAKWGRK